MNTSKASRISKGSRKRIEDTIFDCKVCHGRNLPIIMHKTENENEFICSTCEIKSSIKEANMLLTKREHLQKEFDVISHADARKAITVDINKNRREMNMLSFPIRDYEFGKWLRLFCQLNNVLNKEKTDEFK